MKIFEELGSDRVYLSCEYLCKQGGVHLQGIVILVPYIVRSEGGKAAGDFSCTGRASQKLIVEWTLNVICHGNRRLCHGRALANCIVRTSVSDNFSQVPILVHRSTQKFELWESFIFRGIIFILGVQIDQVDFDSAGY